MTPVMLTDHADFLHVLADFFLQKRGAVSPMPIVILPREEQASGRGGQLYS
jgi:hypothetical protein